MEPGRKAVVLDPIGIIKRSDELVKSQRNPVGRAGSP